MADREPCPSSVATLVPTGTSRPAPDDDDVFLDEAKTFDRRLESSLSQLHAEAALVSREERRAKADHE